MDWELTANFDMGPLADPVEDNGLNVRIKLLCLLLRRHRSLNEAVGDSSSHPSACLKFSERIAHNLEEDISNKKEIKYPFG